LELLLGKNLILTPGIYQLNEPIVVVRPDTVVLGLGMPTLVPQRGNISMVVLNVPGVETVRCNLRRRSSQFPGSPAGRSNSGDW
jgi:hypothetical protein